MCGLQPSILGLLIQWNVIDQLGGSVVGNSHVPATP